jgi:hypothetical protein
MWILSTPSDAQNDALRVHTFGGLLVIVSARDGVYGEGSRYLGELEAVQRYCLQTAFHSVRTVMYQYEPG